MRYARLPEVESMLEELGKRNAALYRGEVPGTAKGCSTLRYFKSEVIRRGGSWTNPFARYGDIESQTRTLGLDLTGTDLTYICFMWTIPTGDGKIIILEPAIDIKNGTPKTHYAAFGTGVTERCALEVVQGIEDAAYNATLEVASNKGAETR